MRQTISPSPNIPCQPGWCLAYVNEAFGVRKVYGRAIDSWNASDTQHRDYDFPTGCWVPVWFTLSNEPAGHVALLAPDGSVYSTSDLTTLPHRHPDLANLIAYYAYYGMPLTYLGWTEDVEGTPVVMPGASGSISVQGEITSTSAPIQEDDMSAEELKIIRADINSVHETVIAGQGTARADIATVHNTIIRDVGGQLGALREIVNQLATKQGVAIDYDKVEEAAKAGVKDAIESITVTVKS